MKKIFLTLLILPVFVSAEPWVDYELSDEVIEMTVVTVKPGMKDDYLMGIKKTWVDACKIQKELGHIIGCGVYTANTAGTDPNVFLTIRYENLAAMGPNKEKYNAKYIKTYGDEGRHLGPDKILHDQISQIMHCKNVLLKDSRLKFDPYVLSKLDSLKIKKRINKFINLPKFKKNTR